MGVFDSTERPPVTDPDLRDVFEEMITAGEGTSGEDSSDAAPSRSSRRRGHYQWVGIALRRHADPSDFADALPLPQCR